MPNLGNPGGAAAAGADDSEGDAAVSGGVAASIIPMISGIFRTTTPRSIFEGYDRSRAF